MKSVILASVLVLALSAGATAFAAVVPLPAGITAVPLAVVTNDRDTSVSHLELMLDAQAGVRGIYMETRVNAESGPESAKAEVYPLAEIETGKGVVLGQGQGVKAIFLRGSIASRDGQGSLVIRYLANGVFRRYAECRIDIQRLGPDRWQLVNAYDGRPIERMQVQTWALGISTIANVCPGTALQ
ncbi:MAG: hypothetical protein OJF55_000858 [Rhodanobacteraceae bacterium]|jgi:hypothetical protein|nr:MAG: hypothetical protein OJF55_000858 [Rhodanobacteraceae bacterium]